MKLPKQALITITTAATIAPIALIAAVAAFYHPAPPSPSAVTVKGASTTVRDSTTSTSTVHPSAPAEATSTTDSTTAPDRATSAHSAPANTNTVSDTSQTPSGESAPAVVAVSATLSDWSAPVPAPSITKPDGTEITYTVSYQYCVWTYSDGSTQKLVYATRHIPGPGGIFSYNDPAYDCTVATAP